MATKPFHYQPMFPLGPDTTEYYRLTSDYVKVENWGGHEFLVVDPEALTVLARQATHDNAFMLRREHNEMVAKILHDPEASDNDKFVALTMLRNAEIAAKGELPFCQDTGTAIVHGEKGQRVYTGCDDAEKIPRENLLIISDDIALPFGTLRIRQRGSAGGHNGMRNIILHLGTQVFQRIRVGVGAKPEGYDLADYVLSRFPEEEEKNMQEAYERAAQAAVLILTGGADRAMNEFNQER